MPPVTFYHLGSVQADRRLHFACRLTAKAFQDPKATVWLRCTAPQAQILEDWLWTFEEGSFLPHQPSASPPEPGVRIFFGEAAPQVEKSKAPITINLINDLPEITAASRILEILLSDEKQLSAGRERYRAYQAAGCALEYHKLPNY
jgi:DNA polymerase-3 subunit chi